MQISIHKIEMKEATLLFVIGTTLCLFLSVWLLPKIVAWIEREEVHFVISGFQDLASSHPVHTESVSTSQVSTSQVSVPPMEQRSSPFFRSGMCNGTPCPEGTFCDEVSQTCISLYPSSETPDTGYYS